MIRIDTERGSLTLPADYSIEVERHNPLLSDDGDYTYPMRIPASSENKRIMDNIHRMDRFAKYFNRVKAILTIGSSAKAGTLVVDTAHGSGGIDASFAIESSELYTNHCRKTLREILKDKVETYGSIGEAVAAIANVYFGNAHNGNWTAFPVAVSPYYVDGKKIYQYNNVPTATGSEYHAREVKVGVETVSVPEGYGVSPFLYLHALVRNVFGELGYTVTENCFVTSWRSSLVVLNNCSDTLCLDGKIRYSDLVPSCTLGDFISWLKAKFYAGVSVDGNNHAVSVRCMEDVLNGTPDIDITGMSIDGFSVGLAGTSRVVITPSTGLEGARPATDTFDAFQKKNKAWIEVDEQTFQTLALSSAMQYGCIAFRKATGEFYEIRYSLDGTRLVKNIGTNYFTYDRCNSENTEALAQHDEMPPMIVTKNRLTAPFIGQRLHLHTRYTNPEGEAGEKDSDEQAIILVREFAGAGMATVRAGTTQRYIPQADGTTMYDLGHDLTAYGLYPLFFARWNNLLLNHQTRVSGKMLMDFALLTTADMTALKTCGGQKLLPVSLRGSVGMKTGRAAGEFVLVKSTENETEDSPVTPSPTTLAWVYHGEAIQAVYDQYQEGEHVVGPTKKEIWSNIKFSFIEDLGNFTLPVPSVEGHRICYTLHIRITMHVDEYNLHPDTQTWVWAAAWDEDFTVEVEVFYEVQSV